MSYPAKVRLAGDGAICRGLCLSAGGGLYTQILSAIPPRLDWREAVLFAGVCVPSGGLVACLLVLAVAL